MQLLENNTTPPSRPVSNLAVSSQHLSLCVFPFPSACFFPSAGLNAALATRFVLSLCLTSRPTWLALCRIAASCFGIRLTVLRVSFRVFFCCCLFCFVFFPEQRLVPLPLRSSFCASILRNISCHFPAQKNLHWFLNRVQLLFSLALVLSPLARPRSQFASTPARPSPPAPVFFSQCRASYH